MNCQKCKWTEETEDLVRVCPVCGDTLPHEEQFKDMSYDADKHIQLLMMVIAIALSVFILSSLMQ